MKTESKIGLLIVTGAFYPDISGEAVQMMNLCQRLPKEVVNIYVLTTTFNPLLEDVSFMEGIYIYRICLKYKGIISTLYLLLRISYLFLKIQKNIDIVQFSGFSNKMILLSFISKLLGKKIIQRLTLVGEDDPLSIRNQHLGIMKYFFYSKADFYISISPALTKLTSKSISKEKIVEIPIGVDTDRFQPQRDFNEKILLRRRLSLPLDRKIIIFVGLICKRKGVDIIIDTWKMIRETEKSRACIALIGLTNRKHYMVDEDFIKGIRNEILSSGMESEIFLIEENNQIDEYLKASDIFIFPTRREGLPNALIEAISAGLPCIASKIEGVTDRIIRDGIDGFLMEREDIEGYSFTLKELLNNETSASKMGLNARQRSLKEFSIDKVAQQHLKLYQQISGHLNHFC